MLDNGFLLVPESAITKIFLQGLERIHRCADMQISDVQIDFVFSGANYKLSGRLLKFLDFLWMRILRGQYFFMGMGYDIIFILLCC